MGSTFNVVLINRGMVASRSRSQLKRTHFFPPVPPELRIFVSRDWLGPPVSRQPTSDIFCVAHAYLIPKEGPW